MEIYYISGSPCCGKSTIAEMLVKEYNFTYFKLDDFLFPYIENLACAGNKLAQKILSLSPEETWMRPPQLLCEEEIQLYRDMYPYIKQKALELSIDSNVLLEGAGIFPSLLSCDNISFNRYICVVPTKEFQFEKYSARPWVSAVLEGCSKPKKAFKNWMERDHLCGCQIKKEAEALGYKTIIVDGKSTIKENHSIVKQHFELC